MLYLTLCAKPPDLNVVSRTDVAVDFLHIQGDAGVGQTKPPDMVLEGCVAVLVWAGGVVVEAELLQESPQGPVEDAVEAHGGHPGADAILRGDL